MTATKNPAKIGAGKNAFTLIELLIGISVSLIITASTLSALMCALKFKDKIFLAGENLQNTISSINTITNEIKASKNISYLSTSNKLVLEFDSFLITYDLVSNKIRRVKNSASQYLTPDNSIGSFYLAYPSSDSVRIHIQPNNSRCAFTIEAFSRN